MVLKNEMHVIYTDTRQHFINQLAYPKKIKPCHSKFMIFHAKIGSLGKCLYESHTLLRDKSYLIWRTIILYLFENFAVATP